MKHIARHQRLFKLSRLHLMLTRAFLPGIIVVAASLADAQTQEHGLDASNANIAAPKGCPMSTPLEVEMPLLDKLDQALIRESMNLDGEQRFPVCAFRALSDSNRNKNWVEQFVPTNAPAADPRDKDQIGWRLVSVEGRDPTERELAKYKHRGGMLYPYLDLHELVDFSLLRVTERNASRVVFETQPTVAFLEKNQAGMLTDHVVTTLVVDTTSRRIDFVTTTLNEEFKPNPFMRVYDFDQSLDYEYVPEVGEVILTELKMRADVKFVVVRRQFHLNADLYDFSCPAVLQPVACQEPVSMTSEQQLGGHDEGDI